jgi:hypothetical protein
MCKGNAQILLSFYVLGIQDTSEAATLQGHSAKLVFLVEKSFAN